MHCATAPLSSPAQVFHLLNFLVCGLRSSVFALRYKVEQLPYSVVQAGLLDLPGEQRQGAGVGPAVTPSVATCSCLFNCLILPRLCRASTSLPHPLPSFPHPPPPGLLFFSTYTLLVLFWAEIYYQARSLPTGSLRPAFVVMNLAVYAIQVGAALHAAMAWAGRRPPGVRPPRPFCPCALLLHWRAVLLPHLPVALTALTHPLPPLHIGRAVGVLLGGDGRRGHAAGA